MKKSVKAIILSLVLTATGFAETPVQLGAWSVVAPKGNHAGDRVVMLQTTSQTESLNGGETPAAKLDVICRNGKLSAIALEPAGAIRKAAISFTGTVPTTRVAANDQTDQFDTWAVTDGGRTLTPYSEAFQGKATAHWIERISGTQKLSFQVEANTQSSLQTTFETGQLSEALFSVGCSY
jgi:hypothetical protein